jgi:hypothetical protein
MGRQSCAVCQEDTAASDLLRQRPDKGLLFGRELSQSEFIVRNVLRDLSAKNYADGNSQPADPQVLKKLQLERGRYANEAASHLTNHAIVSGNMRRP